MGAIIDIMYTLINGFSLTYGLVSFFLNPAFPYPGNDFIIILFLFYKKNKIDCEIK